MYHIQVAKRKNSSKFKPVRDLKNEEEVLIYMKENGLKFAGTPYIFTHILLSDGSIITQTTKVRGDNLICSPVKLRNILESKK